MPSQDAIANPAGEYEARLVERRAQIRHLGRRSLALSLLRFAVFLIAIAMVAAFVHDRPFAPYWFALPVLAFVPMVGIQEWATRARLQAMRAVDFYTRGLGRIRSCWMGTGETGVRYNEEKHPYATDLDIFGPGSLFELLCTAKTRSGQDKIASWLKNPAAPAVIRARQEAVRELTPRLDLREDLASILESTGDSVSSRRLIEWAAGPAVGFAPVGVVLAALLGALAIAALIAWPVMQVGPFPLLCVALLQFVLFQCLKKQVLHATEFAEHVESELVAYYVILRRIERERFDAPHLHALASCLCTDGQLASRSIRRLGLLVTLSNDGKSNMFLRPFAGLLAWSIHFGWLIERWRRKHGGAVHRWVETISEIEALCALAGFAFENPGNVFPEMVAAGSVLEVEGLGHPLLPESKCVRNDLRLGDGPVRLLILSGSNMSGKSTFLRAVGTAMVLALAGSTVRARRLRFSPVAVYASVRNEDSIHSGYSRFYMEILQIQRMIEATSRGPLLFLADEIFHGTNSHDRQIAAEAIARRLAGADAVGIVTTHDLALAKIPEELACAANAHFEDQIENGRLVFDYKLREGQIQQGNALALMRSIGLDV